MKTLSAIREERGVTLEQASRATGVHLSTISRIERGQMPRRSDRAQLLASYYGLTLAEFYACIATGAQVGVAAPEEVRDAA